MPPGLLAAGRAALPGYVETDAGEPVFRMGDSDDGSGGTLVLFTLAGDELCTIHQVTLALQPTMRITQHGHSVARVRKVLIGPTREQYAIEFAAGDRLIASGAIGDHEYRIRRGRRQVAAVSTRWANGRGAYAVQVALGENAALLVAATLCIGLMSRGVD